MTAEGDVNLQTLAPPPEGFGIKCHVPGCGVHNWPHAERCRSCGYDFHWWRKLAYKVTVITLLLLIVAIQVVSLQRN